MENKVTKLDGDIKNLGSIYLGDKNISLAVTDLIRKLSAGKEVFLIEWEGSRIPRGVIIKGQEIGWTQHGIVSSITGTQIGYYERVVDNLKQPIQVMLVFA